MMALRMPPAAAEAAALVAQHMPEAYRRMAHLPSCPATAQAALASPTWRAAIHGLAVSLARRALRDQISQLHRGPRIASAATSPPGNSARQSTTPVPRCLQPGAFDPRKAAANDHD